MEGSACNPQLSAEEDMENVPMQRLGSLEVHKPPTSGYTMSSADSTPDEDFSGEIEVGSLYEIDHKQLPPKSPIQLKAIRAVMVNEKTELHVSVGFPSIFSLRRCFDKEEGKSLNSIGRAHPVLDEQFNMGTNLARKVLLRRISLSEFSRKKHLESFWTMFPRQGSVVKSEAQPSPEKATFLDPCRAALKYAGLVNWGVRRKVKYVGRQREMPPSSSIFAKEPDLEDVDDKKIVKRPFVGPGSKIRRKKKEARPDSKERWSKERYESAELKLMDIMQARGASLSNPILRPELRAEARKHIGDTGLLDHLLKHMAGKVVPQKDVRFRRRHNPEGAMEYWLEPAELLDLRKAAGVQDPYWTPPPGWQPGDGPVMDAACAKEMKKLKEEMTSMKRDLEELLARKHESEDLLTGKQGNEVPSIPTPAAAKDAVLEYGSSDSLQESYKNLLKRKCMLEEQLGEIANSLEGMQVEMRKLAGEVEGAKQRGEMDKEGKPCKMARSSFRICKPQGTFLWPSSACSSMSPQLQAEDFLMVPTPPSASSATSAPLLPLVPPQPSSPVKPQPKLLATVSVAQPDSCRKRGRDSIATFSSHDILLRASSRTGENELMVTDFGRSDVRASGNGSSISRANSPHLGLSAGSWLALATPYPSFVRLTPPQLRAPHLRFL